MRCSDTTLQPRPVLMSIQSNIPPAFSPAALTSTCAASPFCSTVQLLRIVMFPPRRSAASLLLLRRHCIQLLLRASLPDRLERRCNAVWNAKCVVDHVAREAGHPRCREAEHCRVCATVAMNCRGILTVALGSVEASAAGSEDKTPSRRQCASRELSGRTYESC